MLSPMLPRPYRIKGRRCETAGGEVFTLDLRPEEGEPPAYAPGQFNMLYAFGSGEVPISISGDTEGGIAHTVRAVGSVTQMLQTLEVGAPVGLRGPFGRGWPLAAGQGADLVLIAGGLGLAPLRPALQRALRRRERYRRVFLLYGAREPGAILYREELHAWRSRFDLEVEVTVDRGDARWGGAVGVVTRLIERGGFEPATALALLCGPEVMMRFCVLSLLRLGVPAGRIHLSLERNMKCAIGHCGHCQLLGSFVCRDGPVFPYERLAALLDVREL